MCARPCIRPWRDQKVLSLSLLSEDSLGEGRLWGDMYLMNQSPAGPCLKGYRKGRRRGKRPYQDQDIRGGL